MTKRKIKCPRCGKKSKKHFYNDVMGYTFITCKKCGKLIWTDVD